MEVCRRSSGLLLLLGFALLAATLQGVQGEAELEGPSESECRPFIEKALKELEHGDIAAESSETQDSAEDVPTVEITDDDSSHQEGEGEDDNETYDEQGQGEDNKESAEDEKVAEENVVEENAAEQKTEPEKSTDKTKEAAIEDKVTEDKDDTSTEQVEKASAEDDKSGEADDGSEKQEGDDDSTEKKSGEIANVDSKEDSKEKEDEGDKDGESTEDDETKEEVDEQKAESQEHAESQEQGQSQEGESQEQEDTESHEQAESKEEHIAVQADTDSKEDKDDSKEDKDDSKEDKDASKEDKDDSKEGKDESKEDAVESKEQVDAHQSQEQNESEEKQEAAADKDDSTEDAASLDDLAQGEDQDTSKEDQEESKEDEKDGDSDDSAEAGQPQSDQQESNEKEDSKEESKKEDKSTEQDDGEDSKEGDLGEIKQGGAASQESAEDDKQADSAEDDQKESAEGKDDDSKEDEAGGDDKSGETDEKSIEKREIDEGDKESNEKPDNDSGEAEQANDDDSEEDDDKSVEDEAVVEELSVDVEIPSELRSREHVEQLLKLDKEHSEAESILNKVSEITLKELKKLYENAIKPLEVLYKYRDLSNRHFGDAEIFSKPLILFMGPWSGGKSSIINYLTNTEYNDTGLRTGAEPSPAYFNILMYGDEPEVIDGTELAADFTFSGLQKFGQGLEERLKGVKLPVKLLEKVNIVEIPGILEVRKQVSRVFPFNDACQWFIDRADIIFLVYDPSKLDVGPETEAILDQLKGREHQTRIVLNKADQVKPEELMRVQGALIWNISPLMSSPQPPIMYTTSLWSKPFEPWAPVRLLQAQERAFLRDLRSAIEKRIENKIASARRFAVRVRNHAKMVDCYLTTYYNHKSVFGNRKQVADEIIDHPQNYHIYEGLSTLTNISRYDLPDPDVYRDFFKLNPLYEFQQLSATCTYFRGCPINRLDIAIAYDLPELVGTHKKLVENALSGAAKETTSTPGS